VNTLNNLLGYPTDQRLLILTADQLGMCHASNMGVYQSIRQGPATGAGLMVPGPWARHAASLYRGEPVGVHLTLNAELDCYRWRPITQAPSLLDGDGGFPRTTIDLWDHADLDETRRECRAQLERAILWGFDVTHLSSHLGALQDRPEFFDVMLDLAVDFNLPLRLESPEFELAAGFPFRSLAADEGVLSVDHHRRLLLASTAQLLEVLENLAPGATEVAMQPAIDTPELRHLCAGWEQRVNHAALLTGESSLVDSLNKHEIIMVTWAQIRDAQRGS
jgi:chitin disaccharide deacetylase